MKTDFFSLNCDYLFKSVFRNFSLLKMMVFDIWNVDLSGYSYDNPKITSRNKGLSNGEYDLLLTNGQEYVIFEMQNRKYGNFENRTSIYRSTLISSKWEKGDKKYENILPVRIFWLLNDSYHEKEYLKYEMLEKSILKSFGDGNEVHIFNIRNHHESELLNKYQILFNAKSKEEVEALIDDERVGKIAKRIIEYNEDLEIYQEMKRRETMIITHERELALARGTAYRKGEERGITIGKKSAQKEMISNLLKVGVSPEIIAQATQLSEQQIRNYVSS